MIQDLEDPIVRTTDKAKLGATTLNWADSSCQFVLLKGHLESDVFVVDSGASHGIYNIPGGSQDFDDFLGVMAAAGESIATNLEDGIWAFATAKGLI
jgi:hypothetical protein